MGARARILLVNKKRLPKEQWPQSIVDLTDAKWKGRIGMAKPLFGTTATHAACLFAAWGDEKAKDFYDKLKANGVQILSGNKQVAEAVSQGQIDFGVTDTDDAYGEITAGQPVEIIYPDQGLGADRHAVHSQYVVGDQGRRTRKRPGGWSTISSRRRWKRNWPRGPGPSAAG